MNEQKNNRNLAGKRVLIFQQRGWAMRIGHFLAKKLQDEGCKLAALTLKKSTHAFIVSQKEVKYDLIVDADAIKENPKQFLGEDEYTLKEICADLRIDSVWPLVQSSRNHVKCYADKYYYGFKQNLPDEEIIYYIKAIYKNIKNIFEKFNPELIIAPNFVALQHMMFNLYAERRGVAMFDPLDSKIKGYCIFSQDYQGTKGFFHEHLDALNDGKIETKNRDRAKEYIKELKINFKERECLAKQKQRKIKKSLWLVILSELIPYKRVLGWYIKGPSKDGLKNTGVTIDYRPPKIILRDHYYQKINKKYADNFKYYPFDKVDKYIYFPLQFQPESTIDGLSPYFNNQIETARQVAMSLPDDYTLVVKEHPEMAGLRPRSYLEKVAKTPNIKLIDYRISGDEVLRKADLVISPNSTSIAEAAFIYKPAIQLGNLGTTLKLPNVFKHTDMTTLSAKIKELVAIDLINKDYEKKLENYVAAVYDVGFNFDYYGVWEKGKKENMEELWRIYKEEIHRILFNK